MKHHKRNTIAVALTILVSGIALHAQSTAGNAPPSTAKLPSLSAPTQALNAQMENLSDQARAALEGQLGDIVKQTISAANNGNGEYVANVITQQYRDTGEAVIKNYAPGSTLDKQVLKDFDFYSIVLVDKVIIEKDVAYVQAKIVYHPSALPGIIKDQEESVNDTGSDKDNLWSDMGGISSGNQREKDGVGLATYYLVVQQGKWKLHATYFSVDPLTPSDLKTVTDNMLTLVQ